ncbi:Ilm1 protein [Martiniozyma asiatica (nom. inval.)]|nr:Ilm1 protein [Martiniozyma asiatica]
MALFSSRFLLSTRLLCLLYTCYQLIFSPKTVIEYSGVFVLASSMQLPLLMVNEKSPIYGSIGVVLLFSIVSEIGPLLENNHEYFEISVLLRLCAALALSAYSYLGSNVALCNSVVFFYAFAEVWFGILTYTTLKDEKVNRYQLLAKHFENRKVKYERDEMSAGEKEAYEKEIEEDEYKKLMSQFQS